MRPVLIAGPTASGKSGLALRIAERDGGRVINADALQLYACWRVLTARPSPEDIERAPHALYGHVSCDTRYSVGHWLRDVRREIETTVCAAVQWEMRETTVRAAAERERDEARAAHARRTGPRAHASTPPPTTTHATRPSYSPSSPPRPRP